MPAPPDSYTALLVTNQRHHMNWFASERFHWTNIKVNIFLLNNKCSLYNRHYCINYLYKTGHCEAVCYRSSLITNTLALLFVNIPVNHIFPLSLYIFELIGFHVRWLQQGYFSVKFSPSWTIWLSTHCSVFWFVFLLVTTLMTFRSYTCQVRVVERGPWHRLFILILFCSYQEIIMVFFAQGLSFNGLGVHSYKGF